MNEEKPQVLQEPAVAYGVSARERVMASTVSVDEYFDALIDGVQDIGAAGGEIREILRMFAKEIEE